jgi:hypothetical protein
MIGTLYKIRAKYEADTAQATGNVDRLAQSADRVDQKAKDANHSFSGLSSTLKSVAGAAIIGGIGLLARHVGRLASEAENAEISIATVFAVNKVHTFNDGLTRARRLMESFNRASALSPGEGRDFLTIFQATAPQLAKFNPDDKMITQFAGRGLAAAFTLGGGDIDQTGRDLSQILAGQGGADNKLFSNLRGQLFDALEITAAGDKATQQFNKIAQSNPEKVFLALNDVLKDTDEANKAFGNTITGMFGTLKQRANDTLKTGFNPLFGAMKDGFREGLLFIERNEEKIKSFAEAVGEGLYDAWWNVRRMIGFVTDNLKIFLALGTGVAMKKTVALLGATSLGGMVTPTGIGAGASSVVSRGAAGLSRGAGALRAAPGRLGSLAGDAIFALAGTGGIYDRTRAAPGRLRAGAGMMRARGINTIARAGGAGRAVAGAGAQALMFLPGLMKKGALAALPAIKGASIAFAKIGVVAAPLLIVLGMIAGTMRVLRDNTNEATVFLHNSIEELRLALDTITAQFGLGGGSGFGQAVKDFADWLGTGVVGILGAAVKAVERVTTAFSHLIAFFQGAAMAIGDIARQASTGGIMSVTGDFVSNAFTRRLAESEEARKEAERQAYDLRKQRRKEASDREYAELADRRLREFEKQRQDKEIETLSKKAAPNINVSVTNNVDVVTEADPDRVALRLEDITGTSVMDAIGEIDPMEGF